MADEIREPVFVSAMRHLDTGRVAHIPFFPEDSARSEFTTEGFLRKFDEYIAQIKEEAWIQGMRQATDIAKVVILRNFGGSKSATISKD